MILASLAPYALPLGALVVSALALSVAYFGLRQKTDADQVTGLYQRINDLETQVESLQREIDRLQKRCTDLDAQLSMSKDENIRLMRRILKQNGGNGPDGT